MSNEMIEFYESRHKAIPLMIEKKPRKTTKIMIEKAAQEFYSAIAEQHPKGVVLKDGRTVKNIDIAREVFELAKSYANDSRQFEEDLNVFQNSKKIIAELEKTKATLQDELTQLKKEYARLGRQRIAEKTEASHKLDDFLKLKKKRELTLAILIAAGVWGYLGYIYYADAWRAIKCLLSM